MKALEQELSQFKNLIVRSISNLQKECAITDSLSDRPEANQSDLRSHPLTSMDDGSDDFSLASNP